MSTKLFGMIRIAAVAVCIAPLAAAFADNAPFETVPKSKMDSRTRDPKRCPGIFGDYWWANRFLDRHNAVEAMKGQTVDMVLLGDSIIHFWEWKHPKSWQKLTNGRKVLNLGYGGDCTQNVLWRITHGELDGYEAKVVVVMIGTNNNSPKSSRPDNVAKGVEKIVEIVHEKQPKAKVVLMPIFPRGASEASERHAGARKRNDRTNALLKEFAAVHPEIEWLDINDRLVDASGWVPRRLMADEIHPTDAGYDIWMDAMKEHLK